MALLAVLAGAATWAQAQGVAGAATAAAADVAPPTMEGQITASEFPPPKLASPTTSLPTLAAPAIVAAARPKPAEARKLDPKYDVNKIGERGIGNGLDFYSLERERILGLQLSREVEGSSHLVTDPAVTEYVNRVGQNIVRNSDARVPFVIKVIDDDEINAFALPGGFFYVNTGLIMAADNEAELAGVMAHEIAHVAARHATKNATRMQLLNLATLPMIFVGGPVGYAVREVAGLAVPMSFLKFSRDAEREADLLGLEYEYAAGYDPEEFIKFFEKLRLQDKRKTSFLAKAFNTHPMTDDRIRRAQQAIVRYLPGRDQYLINTNEFDEVKSRLALLLGQHLRINDKSGIPTLRRRKPRSDTTGPDNQDKDSSGPTLRRQPQ